MRIRRPRLGPTRWIVACLAAPWRALGRHWLDVARYGDSNGGDENKYFPNANKYRDYVVDAFNRDQPFNEFVQEQIAGDLMPVGDDPESIRRRIIATGFS